MRKLQPRYLITFLLIWFSTSYFYHAGGHNEAARLDSIRAFLETGEFSINAYAYNSADVISYEGKTYSSKAPGNMFVGLLPFWVSNKILSSLGVPEGRRLAWVCFLTHIFSVGLLSALSFLCLLWTLGKLGLRNWESQFLTCFIALGTPCFAFATLFFSHQLTAAMLMFCFFSVFRTRINPKDGNNLNWLLAGGFCGAFAVVSEYPGAIGLFIIGLYGCYVFYRLGRWDFLLASALGVLVGTVPLIFYNHHAFRNIFYIPYEAYASSTEKTFAAHAQGFLGIKNPFTNPNFLPVLLELTFKPLRGLFWASPALLFIFPGFYFGFKKLREFRSEIVLSAALFSSYMVLNTTFGDSIVYWGGGYSFGPRHVVAILPFLAFPLAGILITPKWRVGFIITAVISIWICLVVTSIEPRLPYHFDNPIYEYSWRHFKLGYFNISRGGIFSDAWVVGQSTSFNWGRLLHLPRTLELVPLALIWLFSFNYLLGDLSRLKRSGLIFGLLFIFAIPPSNSIFHEMTSKLSGQGLNGNYYMNDKFADDPILETSGENMYFSWSAKAPLPAPFSARWEGFLKIDVEGIYVFTTRSDDGSWVWIDGELIVDNGGPHGTKEVSGTKLLSVGDHSIRVEYVNNMGGSEMQLFWKTPDGIESPIPLVNLK